MEYLFVKGLGLNMFESVVDVPNYILMSFINKIYCENGVLESV